MILRTLLLIIILGGSPLMAEDRVLFNFENADAARKWQTVNDGVMGGRSDGRFKVNEDNNMEFFGTLSLENNGGFASVRSREAKLGLEKDDAIVIRVRGDGRDYNFRLNVPRSVSRNSYEQSFKTKKDEWIELHEHQKHKGGDVMHEIMKQLDELRHEVGRLRNEVSELREKR